MSSERKEFDEKLSMTLKHQGYNSFSLNYHCKADYKIYRRRLRGTG